MKEEVRLSTIMDDEDAEIKHFYESQRTETMPTAKKAVESDVDLVTPVKAKKQSKPIEIIPELRSPREEIHDVYEEGGATFAAQNDKSKNELMNVRKLVENDPDQQQSQHEEKRSPKVQQQIQANPVIQQNGAVKPRKKQGTDAGIQ